MSSFSVWLENVFCCAKRACGGGYFVLCCMRFDTLFRKGYINVKKTVDLYVFGRSDD